MEFLIQLNNNCLELEEYIVKKKINEYKYNHSFIESDIKNLDSISNSNLIPLGSIDFVTKYLNIHYGLERENPIEIPNYLRKDEFLKRIYRIVDWENIPRSGSFFLKDVTELKNFSNIINATYTDIDNLFNYAPRGKYDSTLVLDKSHLFQVSGLLPIKSEYRVYVLQNEIEGVANYNGDCTLLPDMGLIKKAVNLINYNEKYLKSYTLDIAVGNFGTAILEVHNFTSVGLYSTMWGSNLLYAYRDGIDYLLNDNRCINLEG